VPGAEQLVDQVDRAVSALGCPSVRYPIFNLVDPAAAETPISLLAPFQADIVTGPTAQLLPLLDRLWEAGIPHVRLICRGDSRLDTLVDVVEHAEDVGMITGVRLPRARLVEPAHVDRLAAVGLDYVVLPTALIETVHDAIHGQGDLACLGDSIKTIREGEMTPVMEIPLIRETADVLEEQLAQLLQQGAEHAEIFAVATEGESEIATSEAGLQALPGQELRQMAALVEDLADEQGMQLTWLPPRHAPAGQNVEELVRQGPRAGGDVSICVEADGRVLPPRGPSQAAGNLLSESWDAIWAKGVFDRYRRRVEQPSRCPSCPGLATCASACPADPESWAE
jgi:radical SAM protein with 4Fe4S-binding SPASM domain